MIVLLLFGLAIAIGLAQDELIAKLRAETSHVKRWGGVILMVVGVWTITISIWARFFSQFFPV